MARSSAKARPLSALMSARARAMQESEPASAAPPTVPLLSLTGGVPDPRGLPFAKVAECVAAVMDMPGDREASLQYGGPQGPAALRQALAERLSPLEGVELSAGHFTITSGSAHGLANVCATFLDPGDVVIVESPSFGASLRTIQYHQGELVGVGLDADGIRSDEAAEAVVRARAAGKRVKMIYVIPNFHNPTGVTMSLPRRQELLAIAREAGALIVEDGAYDGLRYEGEELPSLFGLAAGEGVVKLGTFSKQIATGLRLGWNLAAPEVVRALVSMRFDMGSSPFTSRFVLEYLRRGYLDEHLPRMIDLYRRKRDLMLAALEEHCSPYCRWQRPEGGFFLWLRLREPRAQEVVDAAYHEGVMVVPGNWFFADGRDPGDCVRLNFSYVAEEEIPEAIRRLGVAMRKVLG